MRCLVVAVAMVLLAAPSSSAASTFTVSKPGDTADGACDADCSLREAITAANAAPDADTIVVHAGTYALGLTGAGEDANATGDLDVAYETTIVGDGAHSTVVSARPQGSSRGIDRVLDVQPGARVRVQRLTLSDGRVDGDAGGDVANLGTLALEGVAIAHGTTVNAGGGGAGIYNSGELQIDGGALTGGVAGAGDGGGIATDSGAVTLTNVTIAGNAASAGGGLDVAGGTVDLQNVSVSENTALTGAALALEGGAVTARDSVLAAAAGPPSACSGPGVVSSAGHNLSSDASCGLNGPGDLSGRAPQAALLSLSAPTATPALMPQLGSPLVDAGADCAPGDQNGVPRPKGAACDIGAVEQWMTDLTLTSDVPPSLPRTTPTTITYTVVASGPQPAERATFSGAFLTVTVTGASSDAGGCAVGRSSLGDSVSCALGDVAPGHPVRVRVTLQPISQGFYALFDARVASLTPPASLRFPDPSRQAGQVTIQGTPFFTPPTPFFTPPPPAPLVPPPAPCGRLRTGTARADVLDGTAIGDRLVGGGGRDVLRGHGGSDCLEGGAGNDRLDGGPGDDVLSGGPGNDVLTGGPGTDRFDGGPGRDTINARDGVAEIVRCGAGRDTVSADRRDRLTGCERVKRSRS